MAPHLGADHVDPPAERGRVTRRLLLPALVALAAAPATAQAAAPTAVTDPATDVGRDTATLVATVDPNGETTTVRFDYGTTTSYGVESTTRTVDGDDPVKVTIGVGGLTADTTYNVRAVASNASGRVTGANRTFKTDAAPPPPGPPGVSTGGVRDVAPTAATLTGVVNPNGAEASYRFEYGSTTRYGSSTGVRRTRTRETVAVRITGLRPFTVYNYRLVSSNAAGRTIGRNRSFRTGRSISGATITATPNPAQWGQPVSITGRLSGSGISGVDMRLERQEWPYTGIFSGVGSAVRTSSRGGSVFSLPVFRSVRLRVVAAGVASAPVTVLVRPKVGFFSSRTASGRLRVRGSIWPQLPASRVSLQRRTATGRWVPADRGTTTATGTNRSRYALSARLPSIAAVWRVVVLPPSDGAYVRGVSRERTIAGRGSS